MSETNHRANRPREDTSGTGQEQSALRQAAVVGLVMFEAEVRDMIAESQQKW